ncbi:MAG: hypothetical protein JXB47_20905 [Anaerolineae bacterium]|nr:hypothetical protein [Anaerolineae bacterium]
MSEAKHDFIALAEKLMHRVQREGIFAEVAWMTDYVLLRVGDYAQEYTVGLAPATGNSGVIDVIGEIDVYSGDILEELEVRTVDNLDAAVDAAVAVLRYLMQIKNAGALM